MGVRMVMEDILVVKVVHGKAEWGQVVNRDSQVKSVKWDRNLE